MRIAFFIEFFLPSINGVLTSTLNLASNLKKRGHHVIIVTPEQSKPGAPEHFEGVEVVYSPSLPTPIYPDLNLINPFNSHIMKRLAKDRIEICHFTGPFTAGMTAVRYAKLSGALLVQTFHTMLNEDGYILYFVKLRTFLPLAKAIAWGYFGTYCRMADINTAPSAFAMNELNRRFKSLGAVHIDNGIDMAQFENPPSIAEVKKAYPLFSDKTFVFVGRVGQEKAIDVTIRAMREAHDRNKDIRLFVIGDGPSMNDMKELVRELKLEQVVHFTGKIQHEALLASGILQHARGFVTASVTENQSMTVLEAVCCHLPLVVANVDNMREIVENNALLFEPGNYRQMGEYVAQLATDDALHARLQEGSRNLVKRFDGREVAKKFEALYEAGLKTKAARAKKAHS